MLRSSFPLWINSQFTSRDRIGILLALIIGIGGLIFVFLLPDPLLRLAPQIPVLSPQDWPGSTIGTELFLTDNWRVSYSPSTPWSPFLWEERRGFFQSLYLTGDDVNASIDHTVVWYANPGEIANVWKKELDTGTYNSWPIVERRLDSDKPASFLACNPDPDLASSPPQCWYLAYWEHWFTAVFFWRQTDEDLLMQDIHQLTPRIDQLLMSAPAEPCYEMLCTSELENKDR
ncbi:MAG TPA: hypothetical protein VJ821_12880 [Anaerolineales bacterium]|nr:hypothetical protein [Anaerolineales bacterium]